MAEEFDFSALRSYLQGQMDLGDSEVYLDETGSGASGKYDSFHSASCYWGLDYKM